MGASLSEGTLDFTSQPCVFVVGKAKREFLLHSDLVKRKSKSLGKIIDASFAEGQKGCVVLRDDDVETISAFTQFIYTGDYHLSFDMPAPDSENESHDKGNDKSNVHSWRQPRNGLWQRFISSHEYGSQMCSYSNRIDEYCSEPEDEFPDQPCFNSARMDKDYSELFISHAKVHVFAQYYDVGALEDLSVTKLHGVLCEFALSRERIGDIMALVRYCYEPPGSERLRRMVAWYSAAIMSADFSDEVAGLFFELLTDKPEFAIQMAWFLSRRVIRSTWC
ncbi:hypothetical protein E4U45_005494 [Claviceps purpurea]|nr:hypothetical protein E4U45_005494 [Claviceps purpurea]